MIHQQFSTGFLNLVAGSCWYMNTLYFWEVWSWCCWYINNFPLVFLMLFQVYADISTPSFLVKPFCWYINNFLLAVLILLQAYVEISALSILEIFEVDNVDTSTFFHLLSLCYCMYILIYQHYLTWCSLKFILLIYQHFSTDFLDVASGFCWYINILLFSEAYSWFCKISFQCGGVCQYINIFHCYL